MPGISTSTKISEIAPDLEGLAFPVGGLTPLPENPRQGDVEAVASPARWRALHCAQRGSYAMRCAGSDLLPPWQAITPRRWLSWPETWDRGRVVWHPLRAKRKQANTSRADVVQTRRSHLKLAIARERGGTARHAKWPPATFGGLLGRTLEHDLSPRCWKRSRAGWV